MPNPVLVKATAIIMAMAINQINGLEKPLKASAIAPSGLPGRVTSVIATKEMATIDKAPIGMALPMMAAMVPINNASKCHASGLTLSGTGMTNQIRRAMPIATAVGMGLGREGLFIAVFSYYRAAVQP